MLYEVITHYTFTIRVFSKSTESLRNPDCFVLMYNPVVGNRINCFWKKNPLRLFHNALLQFLRGITVFYHNSFLQKNRSGIRPFIYKMNGRTGYFNTTRKYGFMNVNTITSCTAKGRDQGWIRITSYNVCYTKLLR